MSPTLLNLYSDIILNTALESQSYGIKTNGENISIQGYGDDTVILSDSVAGLQILLNRVQVASKQTDQHQCQ